MDYEAALQYIKECAKFGVKLGLERMEEILRRLGNPEARFRTVHIAGTNGKGSTAAMFDSVFQEAGYKTGRYTSPHLVSYRERFTVNGVWITKAQISEIITRIMPVLKAVASEGFGAPTEFEIGTVIAFEFFAKAQADIAVIEVGMGGRFDATNVIRPDLSVITHIDYDHQQYLGDSLEEIAFEKAGIIKTGVPVVIGVQRDGIEEFIRRIAHSRDALAKSVAATQIRKVFVRETGTQVEFETPTWGNIPVKLGFIGQHQAVNCLNVLAGMEMLAEAGMAVSKTILRFGLEQAAWPGRMERIPAVTTTKLYLDGAHNPDGMSAIVETIQTLYPGQKVDWLIGILNNRPLAEMAAILAPVAARVIVTEVPDGKTATVNELESAFQAAGMITVSEPDPKKALELLIHTENPVAVAAGSLYLIGFLRGILLDVHD